MGSIGFGHATSTSFMPGAHRCLVSWQQSKDQSGSKGCHAALPQISCRYVQPVPTRVEEPISPVRQSSSANLLTFAPHTMSMCMCWAVRSWPPRKGGSNTYDVFVLRYIKASKRSTLQFLYLNRQRKRNDGGIKLPTQIFQWRHLWWSLVMLTSWFYRARMHCQSHLYIFTF